MRYAVNQEYFFIRFIVSGIHPISEKEISSPIESIHPWLNKGSINKPEIKKLVCFEHHNVPSEFEPDGEKKYHGFRFACPQEPDSITYWDNQFPHASYGQMSDTADRIVTNVEMSEDGESIKGLYEFYDLKDCVGQLWKSCVKPNGYNDIFSFEQVRKVLLDIEHLLEDKGMAFKIEERKFAQSKIVSIDIVPASENTLSVKELLELKWQDDWL